jgi:hypothetical protein
MSSSHDFIPRPGAAFETFFRNVTDYVLGNNARWKNIPQNDIDEIESQFSIWMNACAILKLGATPQSWSEVIP